MFINTKRKFNYYIGLFISIFIFYLYMAFNIPLTGDDWTWGTNIGIRRLENYFADYNGRYLSNILELLMVHYEYIRYLGIALFSSFLVIFVGLLTDHKKNIVSILIAFILILVTPIRIFSQTFGWTAGFVNYVPSVVLLLVFLYVIRNIYNSETPEYPKYLWIVMIPLGLSTQLIVEHVSIFAVITAIWVISYSFIKHRKFFSVHISYLVSVLIGSAIMFSNGAYQKVLSGNDPYRTLKNEPVEQSGLIEKIYTAFSGNMYKFLFIDNLAIITLIGILIIVLIATFSTANKFLKFVVKPAIVLIMTSAILYLLILKDLLPPNYLDVYTNDAEAILAALFFISILTSVILFVKDSAFKIRTLYYLAGVVLLIAPFIFITPFGPRGVFATYIFMVLVCLELIGYLSTKIRLQRTTVILPLAASIFALCGFMIFVFTMNGNANRERLEYVQEKLEDNPPSINFRELPFKEFHWMSSPKPDMYHTMTFKRYYGIPEDTEIILIPYQEWKE